MPEDSLSFNIQDSGVSVLLGKLTNVEDTSGFRQSLLDGALVMERDIKEELQRQVYSRSERGYRRKKRCRFIRGYSGDW